MRGRARIGLCHQPPSPLRPAHAAAPRAPHPRMRTQQRPARRAQVTEACKREYLLRRARSLLVGGVEQQLGAVAEGFWGLIPRWGRRARLRWTVLCLSLPLATQVLLISHVCARVRASGRHTHTHTHTSIHTFHAPRPHTLFQCNNRPFPAPTRALLERYRIGPEDLQVRGGPSRLPWLARGHARAYEALHEAAGAMLGLQ